ncbi:MAG TPA: LysE family translocator [Rhodoblastus sp.]|nr:LysE family translocator [Rhodoblastus sp.]
MSIELYLAFVAAATALIVAPGPNVALVVANSLAHGVRYGLVTIAGASVGTAILLAVVVFGASALLAVLADWFSALRWIGVAYLLWLGLRAWRSAATDFAATAEKKSARNIFLRGFFVSLSNPKTLLFFGAFLPQFVTPGPDARAQLALLAATFLALAASLDSLWAIFAARFSGALRANGRLRNRLTGGALMTAGLGLALARRP